MLPTVCTLEDHRAPSPCLQGAQASTHYMHRACVSHVPRLDHQLDGRPAMYCSMCPLKCQTSLQHCAQERSCCAAIHPPPLELRKVIQICHSYALTSRRVPGRVVRPAECGPEQARGVDGHVKVICFRGVEGPACEHAQLVGLSGGGMLPI